MTPISNLSKQRGAIYQDKVSHWLSALCKIHSAELEVYQEVRVAAAHSRYDFVVYNKKTQIHYVIESKTRTYVDNVDQIEKYFKTIPLVFQRSCLILITRKYELGQMFKYDSTMLSEIPERSIERLLLSSNPGIHSKHLIIDRKFSRKKRGAV